MNTSNFIQSKKGLPVPTRKELHKEFAGILTEAEFNTNYHNPYRIDRLFSAFKFNQQLKSITTRNNN